MTQKNFNLKKLTKPILVLTTLAFILGLNRSEKKIIDIDDPGLVYQTGKLIYEGEMFTGVVTANYEGTSSTVRSRVRYSNGRRHGLSKTWYRNGELETIRRDTNMEKNQVSTMAGGPIVNESLNILLGIAVIMVWCANGTRTANFSSEKTITMVWNQGIRNHG